LKYIERNSKTFYRKNARYQVYVQSQEILLVETFIPLAHCYNNGKNFSNHHQRRSHHVMWSLSLYTNHYEIFWKWKTNKTVNFCLNLSINSLKTSEINIFCWIINFAPKLVSNDFLSDFWCYSNSSISHLLLTTTLRCLFTIRTFKKLANQKPCPIS